jgi:hypothetical protein
LPGTPARMVRVALADLFLVCKKEKAGVIAGRV